MVAARSIGKSQHEDEPTARLAVLIDADNAQATVIEGILAEVARFGEASVKRIYGDFASSQSVSWKKVLQKYAIKPIQQFAYTVGKNSTDSALIIDAMEQSTDEEGWAHLSTFGSYLNKRQPDFDPRIYGHKKLSDLVKAK
ncbi:NYN domain-containing protein [Alcaligenaceae bacterium CGII-47]|nr:NYN domain-containing protein [Alcaligenaceae bacterium CGII-47]